MNKRFSFAAAVSVLAFSTALFAADWPNFLGPNRDASVAGVALPEHLTCVPVWKIPFGNGFGQIAVVGDKAFAFAQRGDNETAVCLDAKTGKELWHTDIDKVLLDKMGGDGPRSTPTIDGDRVYIYGTHLKLACLDFATGKEIWSHPVAAELGRKELQWGNSVSPIIVDDLVIITTNEPAKGASNTLHPIKGIAAYHKTTGDFAWAQTDDRGTHATPAVATILGKQQVLCFMQSGLVSVAPKTGETLWTFPHPYKTSTAASPVVGGKNGDIVYCSADYEVGAAAWRISKNGDKWSATQLWKTENKNVNHWTTPVYRDGYLYSLVGKNSLKTSDNGDLACLDIETGKTMWTKQAGSQGGIILVGDKLLIQTPRGDLLQVAASPDAYKELGRQNILKGKNWNAPSYANGLVFMRNTVEGDAPAEAACVKISN
ncbi:MAG: PQQ-binding-like beta-propeller repeat protein [Phycisphaerales bacterium]|nr:PQQ-binding-like beta-propeller repeat protein [Phycisphaerales bacterium]